MWGTDMSQTATLEEGRAYVFVAVEHANSEIIGIHAALEPVRQGCIRSRASISALTRASPIRGLRIPGS